MISTQKLVAARGKRLFIVILLVCAGVLSLQAQAGKPASSSTGQNPMLRETDFVGKSVQLARPAARIVTLSPASTEVMFAVGANVVGNTTYCLYPPEAAKVTKIGGFSASSMSVEKILSLKPDLVVSSGDIHKKVTDELVKFGIPVFAYAPDNFAEIGDGIKALARLTGRPEEGEKVARSMEERLADIQRKLAAVPESQRLSIFWEIYDDPLMTCGASTFQHAIVVAAGGRDIFSDLPGSWPRVSAEEVIRRAPQVIMGADDHGDKMSVDLIAGRPGWHLVPAVRDRRIVLLPSALVSSPGPRIVEGVYLAAKALYPRLFP